MHSIKSELTARLVALVKNDDCHKLSEFFALHEDSEASTVLPEVINQPDHSSQETVLHIAASKLSHESLKLLLEHGGDPNLRNEGGQTPSLLIVRRLKECSCEICSRKAVRCIDTLGDHHADFSIQDKAEDSPLFLAAQYQLLDCATALLRNGAPIESSRKKHHCLGKHKSMLSILFEKLPSIVLNVFDRAVTIQGSKNVHDLDCEVLFDLSVILPTRVMESYQSKKIEDEFFQNKKDPDSRNQVHPSENNGHFKKPEIRFPTDSGDKEEYRPKREMGFLNDLLESRNSDWKTYRAILRHPLVSVFTDVKWKSLEILFVAFICMQVGVLIAYTTFLFITIFVDCPIDVYRTLRTNIDAGTRGVNVPLGHRLPTAEQLCEMQLASKLISGYVVVCVTAVLIKEAQHALMDFREYVTDLLNYVQLLGLGSILWTIIIAWDPSSRIYSWLYPVAAFGIAISWGQLFVQIGRFPPCAIYVDMFAKIFVNFCWSLSIYSFILVGFAMSFCVLFPSKPSLVDIPLAMVKVLTMMAGELDYENLFMSSDDGPTPENTTKEVNHKFSMAHPTAAHLWYVAFVIMVTLVLMNLLVGLAVSDIQGCRKDAEIVVMKRRIRYTCYLEKSTFLLTHFLPKFLKDFLRKKITLIKPSNETTLSCFKFNKLRINNYRLIIRPNDPNDKILSEESKHAMKYWLTHQHSPITRQVCKFNSKKAKKDTEPTERIDNFAELNSTVKSPVGDKSVMFGADFVERAIGSRTLSGSANDSSIKRIEKRLADLDHKLDLLVEKHLRRGKSPD